MRVLFAVVAVLGAAALVVGFALGVVQEGALTDYLVWVLPFYVVGLGAWLRRPNLAVVRWLLVLGTGVACNYAIGSILVLPELGRMQGRWALLIGNQMIEMGVMTAALGLYAFFPSGRPERPYERRILVIALALPVLVPLAMAVSQPHIMFGVWQAGSIGSPLYIRALEPLAPVATALYRTYLLWAPIGAGLLVARYRRASVDERQQIRWLLLGAVVTGVLTLPGAALIWLAPHGDGHDLVFGVLWSAIIVCGLGSIVAALFAARVFDVDRLLRRSLVYGLLWSLIAVAYVIAGAALGLAASRTLPLEVAIVLAILATVLFQPARGRLERLADRWVFGERVSGYELLARLGAVLEGAPDAADLLPRLAQTVHRGLGLSWARIRLEYPAGDERPHTSAAASGIDIDAADEPAAVVPLVHGGITLGRLECGPPVNGVLGPAERRLLDHLVRQAATAVHNLYLTAQLSARVDVIRHQAAELADSRARVVEGQDQERRRLQRDLHDGAQQEVVALTAKLGLARTQLHRSADETDATLAELHNDLLALLNRLRDLAYTIHPPVLTDHGLLEAVEAQAARLPVPVRIEADPSLRGVRFPSQVERSAWYAIVEGLTNAVKHANAQRVTVALRAHDDRLVAEVRDDGRGFDPSCVHGLGLVGLADRMDIVGGSLRLDTILGQGTRMHVEIPLAAAAVA